APLRARFVPRRPQPAVAIAGEVHVRLEQRARLGHADELSPRLRAAFQGGNQHAIGVFLVLVPADPDAIGGRVGGYARVPGVAGPWLADRRVTVDADRIVPFVAIDTAGEDVRLAAAPALPNEPAAALLVGGHAVPDVRAGVVGQADRLAEL